MDYISRPTIIRLWMVCIMQGLASHSPPGMDSGYKIQRIKLGMYDLWRSCSSTADRSSYVICILTRHAAAPSCE
ncbi:hypothetical protein PF008_g7784 [Phytophthora fragariae]|uniref:Secreted protein n=1 Tax=Phytophthora fragariae TaxID=53985 RepID=A0A6G0S322_9STRA|nr:hypothetical protein PF008_g7784 [Phytophthora fragariae]